ncbi:unnamed protein product [Pylaiella littoralis]
MFLHPSQTSLVCDLRGAVAAEAGMNFGQQLSAPRPRRQHSVRLGFDIYYGGTTATTAATNHVGDKLVDGGSGGGSNTSSRSSFSPAVSDYAGVFEAGFDPAQVRASMNRVVEVDPPEQMEPQSPLGLAGNHHPEDEELEEGPACATGSRRGPLSHLQEINRQQQLHQGGRLVRGATEEESAGEGEEDEEIDFLFEMEGLKEPSVEHFQHHHQQQHMRGRIDNTNNGRGAGGGGGGGGCWSYAAAAAAATTAAAAAAAGVVAAGDNKRGIAGVADRREESRSRGGDGGDMHTLQEQQLDGATTTQVTSYRNNSSSIMPTSPGGASATGKLAAAAAAAASTAGGGCGTALRQPRAIAPRGARCVGGGMYRLRLSTSC